MKKIQKKIIIAWAGFSGDKIHLTNEEYTHEILYPIYKTKAIAHRCYQDVRKVEIKIL